MNIYYGELAALYTAIFWTVTAIAFESAGKKIGSLPLNLLRMVFALLIYSIFNFITRDVIIPLNADIHQWIWLSISGLIGFVLGDFLLFKAYIIMGARLSMLIMSLVPAVTAMIAWIVLGETMSRKELFAMFVIIFGIVIVVLKKSASGNNKLSVRTLKLSIPVAGIFLALGSTFGQAGGLILSKYGMQDYDPFLSSQIRIIAGLIGFTLIVTFTRRWGYIKSALKNKKMFAPLSIGSVFGPFLGVSFSLIAIQNTSAGIASSIMSIVPVLIILPSWLFFKEKIKLREIVGSVIAVAGVGLFFL